MKLELKHLAPYLPYGIQIETVILAYTGNPPEPSHDEYGSTELTLKNIEQHLKYGFRPILRPLSDLEKHSPELIGEFNLNGLPKKEMDCVAGCSYEFVIELFKRHFDVFGLIEKGLAIDINTLDNV